MTTLCVRCAKIGNPTILHQNSPLLFMQLGLGLGNHHLQINNSITAKQEREGNQGVGIAVSTGVLRWHRAVHFTWLTSHYRPSARSMESPNLPSERSILIPPASLMSPSMQKRSKSCRSSRRILLLCLVSCVQV